MQKKVWRAMRELLRNAAGEKGVRSIAGACPRTRSRIKRAGGGGLRQAEMAVAEGIEDVRRAAATRPMTGSESGSDGR